MRKTKEDINVIRMAGERDEIDFYGDVVKG